MSKTVKKSAKTVQEAIELALAELKLSKDEANIEIIEEGSKGLFGLGAKDAVVQVTSNVSPENRARTFLEDVFACMGMRIEMDITFEEKVMNNNVEEKYGKQEE